MFKVIEITEYLSLDELIKRVWERGNFPVAYESESIDGEDGHVIFFNSSGAIEVEDAYAFKPETKIEYKTHKRVTGDMVFDYTVSVDRDGYTFNENGNSIDGILNSYSDLVQILVFVNGKYRTVWESED